MIIVQGVLAAGDGSDGCGIGDWGYLFLDASLSVNTIPGKRADV